MICKNCSERIIKHERWKNWLHSNGLYYCNSNRFPPYGSKAAEPLDALVHLVWKGGEDDTVQGKAYGG